MNVLNECSSYKRVKGTCKTQGMWKMRSLAWRLLYVPGQSVRRDRGHQAYLIRLKMPKTVQKRQRKTRSVITTCWKVLEA